jgi:hypothetical protein
MRLDGISRKLCATERGTLFATGWPDEFARIRACRLRAAIRAKPNTDVVSRKAADEGLGSRGEDVRAEAKKRLANAASDLGGLQGAST